MPEKSRISKIFRVKKECKFFYEIQVCIWKFQFLNENEVLTAIAQQVRPIRSRGSGVVHRSRKAPAYHGTEAIKNPSMNLSHQKSLHEYPKQIPCAIVNQLTWKHKAQAKDC